MGRVRFPLFDAPHPLFSQEHTCPRVQLKEYSQIKRLSPLPQNNSEKTAQPLDTIHIPSNYRRFPLLGNVRRPDGISHVPQNAPGLNALLQPLHLDYAFQGKDHLPPF